MRGGTLLQHGFVGGPVLDLKPQAIALMKLLDVQYPAPMHSGGCHQLLGYPTFVLIKEGRERLFTKITLLT